MKPSAQGAAEAVRVPVQPGAADVDRTGAPGRERGRGRAGDDGPVAHVSSGRRV
ncbi:hypothetical protein [Streptomyces olivaceus]|uniref:hypothetical protein n=1 Tax=Streptomyces olivaceus TaxID=47716 RepID=UPI004055F0FD